ncbi:hypothetical protein GVO57_05390 [Sphingomonas changnyeongensis]|uniref:Sulfotransferase family protein n=1 Tax=Sphingomonas changnyeongensis TaxID=2698679 RepID=A0A7Z2S877_9SPHN|nr:hypothetical protein [Sphingomonas changnyeongensis]QHL90372.1 hypothetical protein GVO57_05390 [Sphingomonas changnyeongensis]
MTAPSIAEAARDAGWLAHRYDPTRDAIHLTRVSRADHRASTFITDDYLPAERAVHAVDRRALVAAVQPVRRPVHFIFHSAFCCSTLIARLLDHDGVALALKEPVLINDLVGWRHRGAQPRAVAEMLDHGLTLLARGFDPAESVVIKPANVMFGLYRAALAMRPEAQALFLHAPLPIYLSSILKKGMEGRLWVRTLIGIQRLDGLPARLGLDDHALLHMTDLQIAAAGWLAQHALFRDLLAEFGPGRVRTLDSEVFLDRPADAISALAGHFRLGLDSDRIAATLAGPAFNTDSKRTSEGFSRADRQITYDRAAEQHRDEYDKVLVWADAVARNAGIAQILDHPLI